MTVAVHHGDMLQAIPLLVAEGVVCDACVTDPPYHLVNIADRAARRFNPKDGLQKNGAMARLAGGFMGQQWDGGDIAFRPETWATVATIMRPGAFLVAFGGTRTYHRLVSAIEDAGFVIQDQIAWMFATGFPKRRDMLKPAFEPICLAYKPGGKRTMQVGECRIGTDIVPKNHNCEAPGHGTWGRKSTGVVTYHEGRWPANVCHDGSDEVVACFPESAGQQGDVRGDEPSAVTDAVYRQRARVPFNRRAGEATAEKRYTETGASDFAMLPGARRSDAGSAARFFFSAKAGSEDRWGSRHPTVKPVDLISWLVKLVTPPGGTFLDPFAGSGTAAVAALKTGRNAILVEREDQYVADIKERVAFYEGGGGHSVQVKNRNRNRSPGPLFDPEFDPEREAKISRGGQVLRP